MDLSAIVQQLQGAGGLGALAEKLGLSPDQTHQVAASAAQHVDAGTSDAAELAQKVAQSTGLDAGAITSMLPGLLGGLQSHAGGLGEAAQNAINGLVGNNSMLKGLLAGLDKDKDGSVVDDAVDLVKGLFGDKSAG
jgi:hypothetical protein